jgi:hypothetical protein
MIEWPKKRKSSFNTSKRGNPGIVYDTSYFSKALFRCKPPHYTGLNEEDDLQER